MSIAPGDSIGLEVHHDTDQFLRLDAGVGKCIMGPDKDNMTIQQEASDGWAVQVPAGVWHDIITTGEEPMQVYAIYAPSHHAKGIVQETAEQAEQDEESGKDVPPEWTVQPSNQQADEHA